MRRPTKCPLSSTTITDATLRIVIERTDIAKEQWRWHLHAPTPVSTTSAFAKFIFAAGPRDRPTGGRVSIARIGFGTQPATATKRQPCHQVQNH